MEAARPEAGHWVQVGSSREPQAESFLYRKECFNEGKPQPGEGGRKKDRGRRKKPYIKLHPERRMYRMEKEVGCGVDTTKRKPSERAQRERWKSPWARNQQPHKVFRKQWRKAPWQTFSVLSVLFFLLLSLPFSLSSFPYFVHLTNHSHQVALLLARTMGTMAISHHTSLEFPSLLVFLGEEVNEGHEGRNSYCGSTGNSQANH